MNISGIRTYAGFYDYNTIKTEKAECEPAEEILESPAIKEAVPQEEERTESTAKEPDSGAVDFAAQYQPDAFYELKGDDSDIANLDVEKALSDLKKDQILQQYQYFVGENRAGEYPITDRESEDFSL